MLPYPGGRHPRLGFLEGAVAPRRDTKVSIFAPWARRDYAVADLPEAIWWQHGLLYLAHEHDAAPPTPWRREGIALPPVEWEPGPGGRLANRRVLPSEVAFGAEVCPCPDGVAMELWLENGSPDMLRGLRVQICVMVGRLAGFAEAPPRREILREPLAVCGDGAGRRWLLTAWERCRRAWGNPACPCIHSDPQFPDLAPGERSRLRGWLGFYEGDDPEGEWHRRLARSPWLGTPPD